MAFSPTGGLIATHSGDRWVVLWDTVTRRQVFDLPLNAERVWAIAFSPDGDRLAVAGDGIVRMWDPSIGSPLRPIKGHPGSALCLAFAATTSLLVTGSSDGVVRLWNAADGELIREFAGHSGRITAVALSPGGDLLASGSDDGTLRFWDPDDGRMLATCIGQPDGWLTLFADGSHKRHGELGPRFWWRDGLRRVELSDLDDFGRAPLPIDAPTVLTSRVGSTEPDPG